MVERTVMLDAVFSTYAPPAWHFLQDLHDQMPTAVRFMEYLPQKWQKYLRQGGASPASAAAPAAWVACMLPAAVHLLGVL